MIACVLNKNNIIYITKRNMLLFRYVISSSKVYHATLLYVPYASNVDAVGILHFCADLSCVNVKVKRFRQAYRSRWNRRAFNQGACDDYCRYLKCIETIMNTCENCANDNLWLTHVQRVQKHFENVNSCMYMNMYRD